MPWTSGAGADRGAGAPERAGTGESGVGSTCVAARPLATGWAAGGVVSGDTVDLSAAIGTADVESSLVVAPTDPPELSALVVPAGHEGTRASGSSRPSVVGSAGAALCALTWGFALVARRAEEPADDGRSRAEWASLADPPRGSSTAVAPTDGSWATVGAEVGVTAAPDGLVDTALEGAVLTRVP